MSIEVTGSDWDVPVLRALESDPPPREGGRAARQLHVAGVLINQIGPDLQRFLHDHAGKYLAHHRGTNDPVSALVGWMSGYYLDLHDFLGAGPAAVPGWSDLARRLRAALGDDDRLLVTMQLGHTLLLPPLVEEATGRAAYPLVHDRNEPVLAMYHRELRQGRPLVLTALTAGDLRRWVDSEDVLLANLDTAYPGTRQVRSVPFLGGRLDVPVGLLRIASRTGIGMRAVAAISEGSGLTVHVSPRLQPNLDGSLRAYAEHFERCVAAHPEQWMAWASLRDAPDRAPDRPIPAR